MTAEERAELARIETALNQVSARVELLTDRINTLLVFQGRVEEREAARVRACDEHNASIVEAWEVIRETQRTQLVTAQQVAALLETKGTVGVVIGKTAAVVLGGVLSLLSTAGGWLLHLLLSARAGGHP